MDHPPLSRFLVRATAHRWPAADRQWEGERDDIPSGENPLFPCELRNSCHSWKRLSNKTLVLFVFIV